jgi:hypothetical protein
MTAMSNLELRWQPVAVLSSPNIYNDDDEYGTYEVCGPYLTL